MKCVTASLVSAVVCDGISNHHDIQATLAKSQGTCRFKARREILLEIILLLQLSELLLAKCFDWVDDHKITGSPSVIITRLTFIHSKVKTNRDLREISISVRRKSHSLLNGCQRFANVLNFLKNKLRLSNSKQTFSLRLNLDLNLFLLHKQFEVTMWAHWTTFTQIFSGSSIKPVKRDISSLLFALRTSASFWAHTWSTLMLPHDWDMELFLPATYASWVFKSVVKIEQLAFKEKKIVRRKSSIATLRLL